MSPKRIVERALKRKLNIIGICDHNSAENVVATCNVGREYGVTVFPGMEVTTTEEVHIIALFASADEVLQLQNITYDNLAPGENNAKLFGEQIIVNELDEIEGYNNRLLIGATSLTINTLINHIHSLNGIAIASHIDRESYSIIGQLGFIPQDLKLDALEISPHTDVSDVKKQFPDTENFSLINASDAHFLDDIGTISTQFTLAEPTFSELTMALRKIDGRSVVMKG
jgi:PHP family Zn ribbon phosphoesterase